MAVLYLYMRYKFNWDAMNFSMFSTYSVIVHLIGKRLYFSNQNVLDKSILVPRLSAFCAITYRLWSIIFTYIQLYVSSLLTPNTTH